LSHKTAWLAIRTYGERTCLSLPVHPHMQRHACGFALADQGADTRLIQDYLGHVRRNSSNRIPVARDGIRRISHRSAA